METEPKYYDGTIAPQHLGQRVYKRRQQLGLTQKDVAKKSFMSRSHVVRI